MEVGNLTKVHFTTPDELAEETGIGGEAMWITITEVAGGFIRGRLENQPLILEFDIGDNLWFECSSDALPEYSGREHVNH